MFNIPIDSKFVPLNWQENLEKNNRLGGVMLVFVDGKDKVEINKKVKLIKNFCKSLKKNF